MARRYRVFSRRVYHDTKTVMLPDLYEQPPGKLPCFKFSSTRSNAKAGNNIANIIIIDGTLLLIDTSELFDTVIRRSTGWIPNQQEILKEL
jgi:hypothetical protein